MEKTTQVANEHFFIRGQVGSASFPPWIMRHAARLGLRVAILGQSARCVEVILHGPPVMLDAMALACSLGPQEVWVDHINRMPENAVDRDESSSPIALKLHIVSRT